MGEVELDGKVLVLKRIHVTYHLALDEDADREAVDRVLRIHPERCPVYRSIHPQIEVTTALELSEVGPRIGLGRSGVGAARAAGEHPEEPYEAEAPRDA